MITGREERHGKIGWLTVEITQEDRIWKVEK
jgi:hypothetical protein